MQVRAGDLLPALGVLAMLAIALRHALGRGKNYYYDGAIASVPIVLAAMVLFRGQHNFGVGAKLGLIGYPPVFAAVMAVALAVAAWRLRRRDLLSAAATGLVLAAATFGARSTALPDLNWSAAMIALGVTMVVLAIIFRSQYWALGAAAVVAFGATFADLTRTWTAQHELAPGALFLVIVGVLVLVVHALFRSRQMRYVAVAGTLLLALGVMHSFVRPGGRTLPVHRRRYAACRRRGAVRRGARLADLGSHAGADGSGRRPGSAGQRLELGDTQLHPARRRRGRQSLERTLAASAAR